MKNDVVRWSETNNETDKISNYSERHLNDFKRFEYVVTVPETLLPLPQAAPYNERPALTETKTEPRDRPLASAASNCDTNNYKFNNKKSFLLEHKNVSGVQSKKSRRSCATDLVVSVIQCAPYFAADASSAYASQPLTNIPMRRTVCRSFGLTKFHLLCVQVCCLVFLSTVNVGVAVSISSSQTSNELQSDGLNFIEADDTVLDNESAGHFTHTWAVHIPNGDLGLAENVARDHGFVNLGKIFDDHYHFAHHRVSKRSILPSSSHQTRLEEDERVNWASQQIAKPRSKRDFIRMRPSRTSSRAFSLVDSVLFNDTKWSQMWYLNRGGGLDMNVIPAWKEGITGKGIVVTILDDGLETNHPDIEHNYDPKASYDVNSHDDDPMPQYDMTDSNRHGTRCAGEVAATANNSICAVGIAYGASVGGVRMLDGDVTDAVEARSLSLNPQHIDIYSASWGPDDDGKTVDGPGELASRAFIEGVTKGRRGKGSIFIWASGNGGRELDNCNCDGYTNSIWTLSISSATEEGNVPWYSEKCSSTLATTYSSGGQSEKQVVTTDLHHSCTVSHTGTSASAPLAAGIAALVLESNQNLTWRDLQHIVVRTAKPANLRDPTWSKNGVGRRISHSFGYGLMDAAAMVRVARTWTTVPEQQRCEINAPHVDKVIPVKGYITLQLTVKHCLSVNYLEHVQAKITLTAQRRGDIQLYLKSPAGTKVTLLTSRNHDVSRSGFNQWPFMSVHTWGESPHGNWQLEIHNEGRYMAQITQWDLIFHGTEVPAQPDDPVQITPGQFSPYGNDMDHNHLDFDPNAASGQWRNVEQVGESSLMSSDRTNTACLKATIDRKCLACAFPTFIFDGRCYQECPPHTFTRSTQTKETDKNNLRLTNSESNEELQSTERKRTPRSTNFADDAERTCSTCDRSCFRCYGPLSSQCSTCYPGSQLRKALLSNETYCYVFAERSSGNSRDGVASSATKIAKNGIRAQIAMFLMIIVPALIVISVLVLLSMALGKKLPWCHRGANYTYDRVAIFSENEPEAEVEVNATVEIEYNDEPQWKKILLHDLSDIDSDSDSNVCVHEAEHASA